MLSNLFCGEGRPAQLTKSGEVVFKFQIDLYRLKQILDNETLYLRDWQDKHNNTHRMLTLEAIPLKPDMKNEYKTHALKVATYQTMSPEERAREKEQRQQQRQERQESDRSNSYL